MYKHVGYVFESFILFDQFFHRLFDKLKFDMQWRHKDFVWFYQGVVLHILCTWNKVVVLGVGVFFKASFYSSSVKMYHDCPTDKNNKQNRKTKNPHKTNKQCFV